MSEFWNHILIQGADECWPWVGYRTNNYGVFRGERAHRYMFRLIHGRIPRGFDVLHSCDNPPCVNPKHLWLGNHIANMKDMKRKKRAPKGRGKLLMSYHKYRRLFK